jgi:glycosyltransferase involved in cell wall biosynthesis
MTRSHRILMIAPTSFFLDYGCHVRILEEARALQSQGQHVRIVTYYLGRDWPGLDIVRCMPTPWHADYEVGSSRHKIAFDVLLSWRALVETLRWRPHLIHGHLHEGALIGSVLARLIRVPLVFDFQGSMTAEMLDHGFIRKDTTWHYWWRRLEERIVEMPDAILTSSSHTIDLLAETFNRSHGIYALPDTVNLDFFNPGVIGPVERASRRAALGIPPDRCAIAYLGLLADYQGIPHLLRAVAALRRQGMPVTALVMGFPGMDTYRSMARKLGLRAEDAIFTGKIPYESSPAHLALGDIAVAPKISKTEGNGKILNYMGMGLPVVAYETAISREYLGPLGHYSSPIGDVDALAAALGETVRQWAAGETRGPDLRRRAERHFSWQGTGSDLMQIYRRVWQRNGSVGGRREDRRG